MEKIIIKSIRMVNFRAFRDTTIEFDQAETAIRGMNATGKSTVFMAFSWLLFDKDQFGRTAFEIKPLTETGEPIHQVDSEVMAELLVGGDPLNMESITLKKVFHEKWTKPRGKAVAEFNGHGSLYFFNDVPVTMREYNAKIETICPEMLFRLLTNPLYFPSLSWQEQRKVLFDIAGSISLEEIAQQDDAWMKILRTVNTHKSLDEYKREISSEKRKIKDELDRIPARIDEVQKSIPEAEDWQNLNNCIASLRDQIRDIDKEISDISAGMDKEFGDYRKKQGDINSKKAALMDIEFRIQKELNRTTVTLFAEDNEEKSKLKTLQSDIERIQRSMQNIKDMKQELINRRDILREEYKTLNSQKEVFFPDSEFVCPTCKRPLEAYDIEDKKAKLTAQYNDNKAADIAANIAKGKELSLHIDDHEHELNQLAVKLGEAISQVEAVKQSIEERKEAIYKAEAAQKNWQEKCEEDVEYIRVRTGIAKMEDSVGEQPKRANVSEQTIRKEAIVDEISKLSQRLKAKEYIEQGEQRKAQLEQDQKSLAQKLADLERIEFAITGFTKARIEAIEGKVNSMFQIVKWKLFSKQVNGEEVEHCEAMVNGVPYSNLNSASRIHAGLDIISTLSDHYAIYPPIFLDNRESTTEIPILNSQVISLYVDPNYKVLTIN